MDFYNVPIMQMMTKKLSWLSHRTEVIAHNVANAETVVAVAARLEERGFLVGAIRPPTVPKGTARLRLTGNCALTPSQIERTIASIAKVLG